MDLVIVRQFDKKKVQTPPEVAVRHVLERASEADGQQFVVDDSIEFLLATGVDERGGRSVRSVHTRAEDDQASCSACVHCATGAF